MSHAYAAQWIMASVAQRLSAPMASRSRLRRAAERRRLKVVGDPVHSVSLVYGGGEA